MQIGEYKTDSGLIRAELKVSNGRIESIKFTGDFFIFPEDGLKDLESLLEGENVNSEGLTQIVRKFYERKDIRTPSMDPADWIRAIERALEE